MQHQDLSASLLSDALLLPEAVDPLLRTLQQQRLRQLRKLQQLQKQTELEAARAATLETRLQRQQQRVQEQEAQRRAQRAVKAQQAALSERQRQEAQAAKRRQEAERAAALQAAKQEAAKTQAHVQAARQVQLRLQQASKAAAKQAAMQAIRDRAEQEAEERQHYYLAKSTLVEEQQRRIAEEKKAAEALKQDEERRREALRQLHLVRAGVEEQELRLFYKRKQEIKEAELASRRQELEALRRMKDREGHLREIYARQRREEVQQREAERQQQVAARTQAKMERARSLELQRASLKAALDQLRRDIAQQEEEFKARLVEMQSGGSYSEEVAELQAMLQAELRATASAPSAALLSSVMMNSRLSNSRPGSRAGSRPGSRFSSRPSSPAKLGSNLGGMLRPSSSGRRGGSCPASCNITPLKSSGQGVAVGGSYAKRSTEPELAGAGSLWQTKGPGGSTSASTSPRIQAYFGGQLPLHNQQQQQQRQQLGESGASPVDSAGTVEGLRRLQLQRGPLEGDGRVREGYGAVHSLEQQEGDALQGGQDAMYTLGDTDAQEEEGGEAEASDPDPALHAKLEQLQALLQAEVLKEAEREQVMAAVQGSQDREALMRLFMVEREESKQQIMELAQSLGLAPTPREHNSWS